MIISLSFKWRKINTAFIAEISRKNEDKISCLTYEKYLHVISNRK